MSPAIIYVDVNEKAFSHYRDTFDFTNMPKEWLATYENMSEFERSRWFLERFKCLKSNLYLAGSVRE
jgi:hypothetical protein